VKKPDVLFLFLKKILTLCLYF